MERGSDGTLGATLTELPSVVAAGADDEELARDLRDALEATLEAYLEHGDPVPLPSGMHFPGANGEDPPGAEVSDSRTARRSDGRSRKT